MIECRYFEPTTVAEACSLLAEHGEGARVVAGGQDVALLLRRGRIVPSSLISIHRVAGLDHITTSAEEGLKIGAMVALHRLERAGDEDLVPEMLSTTMKEVADRQIRNRATLGGSICAAHPASDITAVLMTLNAAVRLVSATGERLVDLRNFIAGAFSTTARPDELLQEVVVPVPAAPRWGAAYCRFALRGGDYPVVGAGVFAGHDDGGRCQQARIVLGNCQGAPTRALEAEQRLQGCDPVADNQAVAEAAERAAAHIEPLDEPMASGAYKKDLVRVLAREALEAAVARALAT